MATKIVTKNSSTASAVPTASDLVQGELAVNVADKRLFTEDNGGSIVELGTNPSTLTVAGEITANGGIALGDSDKATFGASDDLQIYHDGSNSYVTDTGTGNLYIRASNELALTSAAGEAFFLGIADGSSYLYHNGSVKLNTTSTGIDVTGTATMGGLTASTSTADYIASITNSNGTDAGGGLFVSTRWNTSANSVAKFVSNSGSNAVANFAGNGDISFYEDTGTTAKLFWDASTERLGLTGSDYQFYVQQGSNQPWYHRAISNGNYALHLNGTGDVVTLSSAGKVGIGTSSPSTKLEIRNDVNATTDLDPTAIKLYNNSDGGSAIEFSNSVAGKSKISFGVTSTGAGTDDTYLGFSTGANASLSERMRIDSSGNLLVGKTSAAIETVGINLFGTGRIISTADGDDVAVLNRKTSDGDIAVFKKDGTTVGSIGSEGGNSLYIAHDDAGLRFSGGSNCIVPCGVAGASSDGLLDLGLSGLRFKDLYLSGKISTNTTTGLSITANANNKGLLNLSTSQSYQLLGGTHYGYLGYKTGGYHRWFGSDGAEDMRLDSSGNLLVGTTSTTPSTGGIVLYKDSTRGIVRSGTSITTVDAVAEWYNPNGKVGQIVTSGSSTSYNTSSDQRLKENIADADDAGSKVDAIQVRKFDWKADGSHQDYGMIAQELLEVAPEAVSVPEDSEEMMGVDYSKLVPMLIKEIQSLRNRVAQLEE